MLDSKPSNQKEWSNSMSSDRKEWSNSKPFNKKKWPPSLLIRKNGVTSNLLIGRNGLLDHQLIAFPEHFLLHRLSNAYHRCCWLQNDGIHFIKLLCLCHVAVPCIFHGQLICC